MNPLISQENPLRVDGSSGLDRRTTGVVGIGNHWIGFENHPTARSGEPIERQEEPLVPVR